MVAHPSRYPLLHCRSWQCVKFAASWLCICDGIPIGNECNAPVLYDGLDISIQKQTRGGQWCEFAFSKFEAIKQSCDIIILKPYNGVCESLS